MEHGIGEEEKRAVMALIDRFEAESLAFFEEGTHTAEETERFLNGLKADTLARIGEALRTVPPPRLADGRGYDRIRMEGRDDHGTVRKEKERQERDDPDDGL